jgi:DNA modification methylase
VSRPGGFRNRERPSTQTEHRPQRQRFEKPALSRQVTTLWDYPSQHYGDEEQGDKNYRGATPSYVIWNVVQRFTSEGDEVVDPFCGSGTTLDVCKDLRRKGHGFDVAPTRPDIQNADARSIPIKNDRVQLVFMDPPYADNLDYSDDPRCLGKLKAQGQWQRAMKLAVKEAVRVLKPEGVLAMFVCDVLKKGKTFHPLGFDLFQLAREEGLHAIDIVSVVRHNRTLEMGNYRKAADEQGFFLRGFNYLLLFRKKAPDAKE